MNDESEYIKRDDLFDSVGEVLPASQLKMLPAVWYDPETNQEGLINQYAHTIVSLQGQLAACVKASNRSVRLAKALLSDKPPSSKRTAKRLLKIRTRLYEELTEETKTNSGAYLAVKDDD